MKVLIWVREGVWEAAVDQAAAIAGPAATFTLLHVISTEEGDALRAGFGGLLGRGRAVPTRLHEAAEAADVALLAAAAQRLGRASDRVSREGRVEREVVVAAADADLLVLSRDGDLRRLGPHSLGRATRFVVDHAPCPVLLVWPEDAPDISSIPPPPPHP